MSVKFDPNRQQRIFTAEQISNAQSKAIDMASTKLTNGEWDFKTYMAWMGGACQMMSELGLKEMPRDAYLEVEEKAI